MRESCGEITSIRGRKYDVTRDTQTLFVWVSLQSDPLRTRNSGDRKARTIPEARQVAQEMVDSDGFEIS